MAAGSPSPMVSVRTPGHACRAPPHEVDLSAQQTGRSRVEVERPAKSQLHRLFTAPMDLT